MAPIQHRNQSQSTSLLHKERISQFVSLSPAGFTAPYSALCATVLSPLLLSYFPAARGIVLAYEDVELSDAPPPLGSSPRASLRACARAKPKPAATLDLKAQVHAQARLNLKAQARSNSQATSQPHAQSHDNDSDISDDDSSDEKDASGSSPPSLFLRHIDEYSAPFLWATATFLVFRPQPGAEFTALLTHQSRTHITLSYLNTFPVSVLAKHLPRGWSWCVSGSDDAADVPGAVVDEQGWWVIDDGEGGMGEVVRNGAEVEVRILDFDGRLDGKGKGKGFLKIEGEVIGAGENRMET